MSGGIRGVSIAAIIAFHSACVRPEAPAGATDSGASSADDAGALDAGASGAGAQDAGASDAGAQDAGASDAGAQDAGASDAGAADGGTASAGELIQDALLAGRIDDQTAALYEGLAWFAPDRLPAEYQGAPDTVTIPSEDVLGALAQRLAAYGPDDAAAVRAMLADPGGPAWLVFPPKPAAPARTAVTAAPAGCFPRYFVSGVDYNPDRWRSIATETRYFRIMGLLPMTGYAVEEAGFAKRIADALAAPIAAPGGGTAQVTFTEYLDLVFEKYLNEFKMKDPRALDVPSATKSSDGTRSLIPIYLLLCDGLNDAAASPSGWIAVGLQTAAEDTTLRRIVLPHEIFHLFEHAWKVPSVSRDFDWPYEASAVAAEDFVAPDVRRWSGRFASDTRLGAGVLNPLDRSFECPEEPLHSNRQGPCGSRSPGTRPKPYYGGYSKFVLIKFLQRNYGLTFADFWARYANANGDPRALIPDDQMAAFQLALLADRYDKEFFAADDRAAFFPQGQALTLDREPGDPLRYTYMQDPVPVFLHQKFRFAPSEASADPKSILGKAEGTIEPYGTHRLLVWTSGHYIDVSLVLQPLSADPLAWTVVALENTVAQPPAPQRITANVPYRLEWGQPPIDAQPIGVAGSAVSVQHFETTGYSTAVTLVLVTNTSPRPVSYRLGIEYPEDGFQTCLSLYGASCMDPSRVSSICSTLLHTAFLPHLPYPEYPIDRSRPECATVLAPTTLVCANGGVNCATTPAGFVPLPPWPTVPTDADCVPMTCW